ncbi:helix-turn-helix transcriptional regulator, partial [Salmonella sp. gx-f5]|nr:helix-turn-helix transcriptional regulator [Salmonella sp. gx-f5]
SDFTHFSHAFRKAFGVTPSSVMKQQRQFFIQP